MRILLGTSGFKSIVSWTGTKLPFSSFVPITARESPRFPITRCWPYNKNKKKNPTTNEIFITFHSALIIFPLNLTSSGQVPQIPEEGSQDSLAMTWWAYDYVDSRKPTSTFVCIWLRQFCKNVRLRWLLCVYEYVDFAKTYIYVDLCVYTKDHTQLANKTRKKRMGKWTWWEPVLRESRLLCHYRNNQYLDAIAILCPWFCKLLNVASSKPQTLQSLFLNLPVMMCSVQWHSCSQFQQQWNHCRLLLHHEHHHLWFLPLPHEHHHLGFLLHEHHHHPLLLLLFSHHHHHHHPFA